MSTKSGGVVEVVILRANANALSFTGARGGGETDAAWTLALQNVSINFHTKMFQHGLNRRGHDLTQTADRTEAHSLREFIKDPEVDAILGLRDPTLRPAHNHVRHFLRAHPATDTLSAAFLAIKAY